jgi:hypothetical protein
LGEVEQVNIILQYKISEPLHRQRARVQLPQKRVCFDRAPNAAATPPQLRAEIFRHELALSKIGDQKKAFR